MFYGHNRMSSIKFTCTNSAQSDFAYSIGLSHKRCLSTTYPLLERELVQPVVYIFCWRISHCLSFFVETVRRYQTCEHCKNIWQFRASSYNSNKLTNQMQQFYKFITWRFVSLNMFRAPPRPSSGAYNCINSLWFYRGLHAHHQELKTALTVSGFTEPANAIVTSWWWAWRRPKHVERHKTSSNKLVKLLHLVG